MSRIQRVLLRKIFSRLVVQGPNHEDNIREVFELLAKASRVEFSEDNLQTQHAFLLEQFTEGFARAHELVAEVIILPRERIRELIANR